jgi:hypothetical protein
VKDLLSDKSAEIDTWMKGAMAGTEKNTKTFLVPWSEGAVLARGVTSSVPGTQLFVMLVCTGGNRYLVKTAYPK